MGKPFFMDKPCFIEISELRAISSDRDNWMVMKRTKKMDKETGKPSGGYSNWVAYKWPSDFNACVALLEGEFKRMSGSTTLTELNRAAKKIHEQMLETLELAKQIDT